MPSTHHLPPSHFILAPFPPPYQRWYHVVRMVYLGYIYLRPGPSYGGAGRDLGAAATFAPADIFCFNPPFLFCSLRSAPSFR